MTDLRTQLPECPLEYEVPEIPGAHTALVISVDAANIDWQEKMLPWTLASLINNTDIVMKGVHLYIACDADTEDRIQNALSLFDLPENTIIKIERDTEPSWSYNHIILFDINHWAFRDGKNQIKLPIEHILSQKIEAPPSAPFDRKAPCLSDMTHATVADYRHAIKHLMGAQLAMKI